MLSINEKLMFLTDDGRVGFSDKKLTNVNINYALRNVLQISIHGKFQDQ